VYVRSQLKLNMIHMVYVKDQLLLMWHHIAWSKTYSFIISFSLKNVPQKFFLAGLC